MRTDTEVEHEISKLTAALKLTHWNWQARDRLNQQVNVLSLRLTPEQVESRYYGDETAEEFKEGDNDLWSELDRTARWLAQEEGMSAPSKGL